jgi:hypothetical protein
MFQRNPNFLLRDFHNMQEEKPEKTGVTQEPPNSVCVDITRGSNQTLPKCFHSCFFGIFTGYVGKFYSETTAIASLCYECQEVPSPVSKREVKLNELIFKAVKHSHDCFLGKLHREAISGSIVFEDVVVPDPFEYVDLAGRRQLRGTVKDILNDGRIFKTKPLVLRSWIYQNMFDLQTTTRLGEPGNISEDVGPLRSLNTIRERSLAVSLVEFVGGIPPIFSPSIAVLLAIFAALFSLDKIVFLILVLLWTFSVVISQRTNTYASHGSERLYTIIPRIAICVWILSLGLQPYKEYYKPVYSTNTPWIFRMISGIILALDVVVGDFRQCLIQAFKSKRYRIRKIFPHNPRVIVCEDPERNENDQPLLPEWLNPDKSAGLCLVVDINGILHRLVPLTSEADLPNPITTNKAINMASIELQHD